jgi:LemA protein
MKTGAIVTLAIIGLTVVTLGGTYIGTYNTLGTLDEQADRYQSGVDTMLQQRGDLIENLASTAKGYATHEQNTIIGYAQGRAGNAKQAPVNPATGKPATAEEISASPDLQKLVKENQAVTGAAVQQALLTLNQVREAVPNLKADKGFNDLMQKLNRVEEDLRRTRNMSNRAVQLYNTKIRRFPGSIIASIHGFEKKDYFEVEAGAKAAPKLKF